MQHFTRTPLVRRPPMPRTLRRSMGALAALLALTAAPATWAWECPASFLANNDSPPTHREEVLIAPVTYHWHPSSEHKLAVLAGYARYGADNTLCGASVFTNSFGQPSATVYIGKRWDGPFGLPKEVFTSVVAGPMYGYVGKYQHKVPLNYRGFSPLVVPTIGYQFAPQHTAQLMILGNSAIMLGYSYRY